MADQEKKAVEQALPTLAKKKESDIIAAPAAPQSMGASDSFAAAGQSIRAC